MSKNSESQGTASLRPYTLIEFVHKGRRKQCEDNDVVPTKWITFDKKKKKCVTQYLPPKPSEEDKLLLHELVKNLVDPPEDWHTYTVDLKGTATTYSEAELKLERLKQEKDVFTQSSDDDSCNAKDDLVEKIKQQKLVKAFQDLQPILNSSATSDSDPLKLPEVEGLSLTSNKTSPSNLNQSPIDDPQQSNCNEEIEKNTIFTNTESAYKIHQEFIEVDLSPVEVNTQSMSATTNNNMTEVVEIKSFNVGADLAIEILQDVQLKVSAIDKRLDQLDVLVKNQKKMIKFLLNKSINEIKEPDFENTYNLKIPFESLEEFEQFEIQVEENELLKADVCLKLSKCIDTKNFALTKSFTSMLRLFFTKQVLSHFTAIRKSKKTTDKKIFVSTRIYKLMSGIMIKTRNEKSLSCENAELHTALSEVISHSGQWTEKTDSGSNK